MLSLGWAPIRSQVRMPPLNEEVEEDGVSNLGRCEAMLAQGDSYYTESWCAHTFQAEPLFKWDSRENPTQMWGIASHPLPQFSILKLDNLGIVICV